MNNIKQAIDYAFSDKVADMQQELVNAVSTKVANALETKRMEIAQDLLNTNEEVEDLEELSKDTLGSYVKKAKKTLPSLHGRDPYGYQKRDKNIDKAVDKLTKEEAEELEELSKKTLNSYIEKSSYKDTHANAEEGDRISKQGREKGIMSAAHRTQGWMPIKTKKGNRGLKRYNTEELEEKLSVSDGVDAWIKDFVHSDDPRFDGKSKKERINQALAAFYAAKKGQ